MCDTCSHIKRHLDHPMVPLRGTTYSECEKPVYRDNLCKEHYERNKRKTTKYKDREGYRIPTLEELKSGRVLHLKDIGSHGGFRYKKCVIVNINTLKETKLPIDPQLFVITLIHKEK